MAMEEDGELAFDVFFFQVGFLGHTLDTVAHLIELDSVVQRGDVCFEDVLLQVDGLDVTRMSVAQVHTILRLNEEEVHTILRDLEEDEIYPICAAANLSAKRAIISQQRRLNLQRRRSGELYIVNVPRHTTQFLQESGLRIQLLPVKVCDGQKTPGNSRVFRGTSATKHWRYLMCLPRSMRGIRLAAKSMPKKMQFKELNKPKSMQFKELYRQAADSLAKAERCLANARRAQSTRAAAIHATARRCIAKARRALSTRTAALSEPEQLRSEKRQATQFKEPDELQRRRQHAERRKSQTAGDACFLNWPDPQPHAQGAAVCPSDQSVLSCLFGFQGENALFENFVAQYLTARQLLCITMTCKKLREIIRANFRACLLRCRDIGDPTLHNPFLSLLLLRNLECKIKRRVAAGNKVIEEVLSNMDRFVQKDDIDFDLETGLHKAVGTGALSHIRPLLAAGADINGRPTCLIGDLSDVVSDSDEKFGGWNLSFGRYHEPPPPLVRACEILKRHEDIAQFGGEEEGESAVPPLTVAKAMVELLLLSNADPNLRAVDGEGLVLTALIVSSFVTNQSDIVTALLERGADINAKDEGDFTALMVATHGGYQNIGTVTALLERGADVHAVGQRNMVHECPTALKLAKTWNCSAVNILKTYGAKDSSSDEELSSETSSIDSILFAELERLNRN